MLKKRLEILIDETLFYLLKEKAREKKCSVDELVRETLREKYFIDCKEKAKEALNKILSGELALSEAVDWEEVEKNLEKRYGDVAD